jgi:hypothetical protein
MAGGSGELFVFRRGRYGHGIEPSAQPKSPARSLNRRGANASAPLGRSVGLN